MQTQISVFQFQTNKPVRVEYKDGEPLFCLADVADVLEIQNPRQLKMKEKGVCKIYTPTNSGKQELLFIDEFNLYRVIFRSNKPEAVKFQDWIFEEVIPQIRKTGGYQFPTKLSPAQKQAIRESVQARHHRTGEHWQEIYKKLHSFLKVNSYHEIEARDFQTALDFLASIENAPAKPEPKMMQFTEQEISQFAVVTYYLDKATRQLKDLSEPLKAIGARQQGVEARTLWLESQSWLRHSRAALERIQPQIKDNFFREHTAETLYRMDRLACLI